MSDVQVRVYTAVVRGPRRLVSASVVDEGLAHDELRDLLHAVGVEHPERAILEGPPVIDGGFTRHIHWEVEDLEDPPTMADSDAHQAWADAHGSESEGT